MKRISLTQNKFALVDDEDFYLVNKLKWFSVLDKHNNVYYARTNIKKDKKISIMPMHRFILKPTDGLVIHHKDHNGLNNTKENLIICTKQQNRWNSFKQSKTKNRFKGVSVRYQRNKKDISGYVSEIEYNKKRIYLGFYKNEIDAAISYNNAALKYFNDYALLNKTL